MKNSILFIAILSLLMTTSCQNKEQTVDEVIDSGKVDLMKERRQELNKEQRLLNTKISKLSKEIEAREDSNSFSLVSVKKIETEKFVHYIEV
ncbi:MAG: hypothetical protein ACTHY4_10710, partial [Flavobacteriaceae bacterium]